MEKKHYQVVAKEGCWEEIHKLLCNKTNNIDFIPNNCIECYDISDHSSNYAYYLLTDEEVETLKNNPNIKSVYLDRSKYPELLPECIPYGIVNKRQYDPTFSKSFPKIYRGKLEGYPGSVSKSQTEKEYNRTGWALKRIEEGNNNFFNSVPEKETYKTSVAVEYSPDTDDFYYVYSIAAGGATSTKPKIEFLETVVSTAEFNALTTKFGYDNQESTEVLSPVKKYYEYTVDKVQYQYSGENVDIIVLDEGVSQYHPEFIDRFNRTERDNPFVGRSRVRDLILDGPYYLDPEAFETGFLKSQKTFKWDGRPTCTRAGAATWWSSVATRSPEFRDIGRISDSRLNEIKNYYEELTIGGPPAPGHELGVLSDFGTNEPISTMEKYRINRKLRSHGNGSAGAAAGLNFGSAVDARIWNITGFIGQIDVGLGARTSLLYDFIKIFHKAKKSSLDTAVRYTAGASKRLNQSPTIVNNSWGGRSQSPWTYFIKQIAAEWSSVGGENGPWHNRVFNLSQQNKGSLGSYQVTIQQFKSGISLVTRIKFDGFSKSTHFPIFSGLEGLPGQYEDPTSAELIAPTKEMIDLGVIWCTAAGNGTSLKEDKNSTHYDDNYNKLNFDYGSKTISNEIEKTYTCRRDFPSDIGGHDGVYSRCINIGAIENTVILQSGKRLEHLASYTNRGSGIDIYAPATDVASCGNSTNNGISRYDAPGGVPAIYPSYNPSVYGYMTDQNFSGTSCACPVTVGVIALYLEQNPSATYSDVQRWLRETASTKTEVFNLYSNPDSRKYWQSKYALLTSNLGGNTIRYLRNPYVSVLEKFAPKSTAFATVAESAPESIYTRVGVSKSTGLSLIKSPPSSTESTYSIFAVTVESVDEYITTTPEATELYKTIVAGFGGRNNGGNAKWERQVDGGNVYFAAAGGGGGGYYGGAGGNIGGGGGGGSGLAREDASDVAVTSKGTNSGDGYVRIWINENADGSRASWKNPIIRR